MILGSFGREKRVRSLTLAEVQSNFLAGCRVAWGTTLEALPSVRSRCDLVSQAKLDGGLYSIAIGEGYTNGVRKDFFLQRSSVLAYLCCNPIAGESGARETSKGPNERRGKEGRASSDREVCVSLGHWCPCSKKRTVVSNRVSRGEAAAGAGVSQANSPHPNG